MTAGKLLLEAALELIILVDLSETIDHASLLILDGATLAARNRQDLQERRARRKQFQM